MVPVVLGPVTVNWWTWDPNQALAYEQCIPAFEKANPGIKVDISQYNVATTSRS